MHEDAAASKDRRKSAPGFMSKPPSSFLLSTSDPAALVVSTKHVFRSSSTSPTLSRPSAGHHHFRKMSDSGPRTSSRNNVHPLAAPAAQFPVVANAWCGGNTSTLEFALRNNDKDLERQERAKLQRAGLTGGDERMSSDGSTTSVELVRRDDSRSVLPASSNRRVFSVTSFPTRESQQQEEFVSASCQSRGRSRDIRENLRSVSRPTRSPGFVSRIASKVSHTSLRSHMWPGVSSFHASRAVDPDATDDVATDLTSQHSSTPAKSTAGHTPGVQGLAKRLSTTALRMIQAQPRSATQPPPFSTRHDSPTATTRPNSLEGPIIMRGFDAPGLSEPEREHNTTMSKSSTAELSRRLGISNSAWKNEDSARIARGRAGSIVKSSGQVAASGSAPTAETESRVNRDLIKLYSRKRVSSPERRTIEARLAGKYTSPQAQDGSTD
ncbi:hypothetical protein ACM66B_003021 [Microbotryomycetes sp. NB124-2]